MTLLRALMLLRAHRADRRRLDDFLRLVRPWLQRNARGFPDPDEVVQVAMIRVASAWPRCAADNERSLRAWLRQIARNCGRNLVHQPKSPPAEVDPTPPQRPDEAATNRARGRAMQLAIEQALKLEPAELQRRDRVLARARRVGATRAGIGRDVRVALALRDDEIPAAEIGVSLGLSEEAIKQAAVRGAAAIALGGRVLCEETPDPFEREALDEIAARLAPGNRR